MWGIQTTSLRTQAGTAGKATTTTQSNIRTEAAAIKRVPRPVAQEQGTFTAQGVALTPITLDQTALIHSTFVM